MEQSPSWELTVPHPVKKFPAFYGNRRFITAFTSARYLSVSSARSIQSIPLSHFLKIHFKILSLHVGLGLPSCLFLSSFPTKTLYAFLLSTIRATCLANLILLDLITRITFGEQFRSQIPPLCSVLHSPVTSSLLGPNIFRSTQFSTHPQPAF